MLPKVDTSCSVKILTKTANYGKQQSTGTAKLHIDSVNGQAVISSTRSRQTSKLGRPGMALRSLLQ